MASSESFDGDLDGCDEALRGPLLHLRGRLLPHADQGGYNDIRYRATLAEERKAPYLMEEARWSTPSTFMSANKDAPFTPNLGHALTPCSALTIWTRPTPPGAIIIPLKGSRAIPIVKPKASSDDSSSTSLKELRQEEQGREPSSSKSNNENGKLTSGASPSKQHQDGKSSGPVALEMARVVLIETPERQPKKSMPRTPDHQTSPKHSGSSGKGRNQKPPRRRIIDSTTGLCNECMDELEDIEAEDGS